MYQKIGTVWGNRTATVIYSKAGQNKGPPECEASTRYTKLDMQDIFLDLAMEKWIQKKARICRVWTLRSRWHTYIPDARCVEQSLADQGNGIPTHTKWESKQPTLTTIVSILYGRAFMMVLTHELQSASSHEAKCSLWRSTCSDFHGRSISTTLILW